MFDVLVVGAGPAGLNAALVLGRCRRRVLVCDAGNPRNARSEGVRGFLGHDGVPPAELRRLARAQLAAYAVRFLDDSVDRISGSLGSFRAYLRGGTSVEARRVLLAPGLRDRLPDVDGLEPRYGTSVFTCPYCDGWEQRDRRLGVLADGSDAVELGQALLAWSPTVTVFETRLASIDADASERLGALGVEIVRERVARLEGEGPALSAVVLEGGRRVACEALFLKPDCTVATKLAAEIGCKLTDEGEVQTEGHGRTCVPGVWAAGDASPSTKMAVVAAAEGAQAATEIQTSLREEDQAQRLADVRARGTG
ncbi:MAG: NAD(P)/FAD-dependent oxidoreductase [Polyangiaceae bacterium]